jgi:RNA polymerase sigma-70 factor (ECF subfamily)
MDERQAIARLRCGDISGLEVLVYQYQSRALEVAVLTGADYALAEDVVQDAFLRAYERIHQFDLDRPFAPWFLRIVINDTLKVLRRRSQVSLGVTGIEQASSQSAKDVESQFAEIETRGEVWQALEQLNPSQRAVIVARYYLGMTDADIAHRLDIAQGTVRWHLSIARQRLRQLLPAWITSPAGDES